MYTFRGNIAERFGVNAAVVAEYLYDGDDDLKEMKVDGKWWYRCSMKMIKVDNPFLTIDMVKHAIKVLRDNGVIRSKKLSKGQYDHTNWYCFTEYGEYLMKGDEYSEAKH